MDFLMAQTLTWFSREFQEIKAGRNRSSMERPRREFALISSKRFRAELCLSWALNLRSQSDEDAVQNELSKVNISQFALS